MSMYLYILSTYLCVLVSTKCPWKVEINILVLWTVANEAACVEWVMLPDYLEQYMSFNQYITVCTWYVLSTYQYVLEMQKSFWGYYVFTFDNGKRHCVYWTGMWWCLKTKTVPDFMANLTYKIPVHTEYIPVHTAMYHFQHYVPVCTWYRPVHTCMYQKPWFRTTGHDSRWYPWIYHVYSTEWIYVIYPWIFHVYPMFIGQDGI